MANKYIRHGETYCGDGTTSAAAASDGGVGAWNNINIFEGTAPPYGALAAGDVVYMRSKDAAGANVSRTSSVSLGSTSGTVSSPITWILDAGTVWSGINGTLTYTGAINITFRENNNIICDAQDALSVVQTSDWPGVHLVTLKGYAKNIKIDGGIMEAGTYAALYASAAGAILENATIKVGNGTGQRTILVADGGTLTLINPDIEMKKSVSGQYLFWADAYYGTTYIECRYGRIWGVGATDQSFVLRCPSSGSGHPRVKIIGTQIPTAMPMTSASYPVGNSSAFEMFGLDGAAGSYFEESWGWATSRTDNNPPVLSGQLPTSALSLWAWRVYPRSASFQKPVRMLSGKIYTDDPSTKTVTLEFLTANTLSINKSNTWMTVEYIDNATGLGKCVSTFDPSGAAVSTSTAAWNVTTWALITCNKNKMSLTTPTSIKKDTLITVTFWSRLAAASANDIFFLDSDFSLS